MSYCFNPYCSQPLNPDINKFCQECGFNLKLKEYRAIKLIKLGEVRTFLAIDEKQSFYIIKQVIYKASFNIYQQEARCLKELNHPQIPKLIDYFEQQYFYLVQEFVAGTSLWEVVKEELFDESQVWRLLENLLPVLKYLHDRQIIHGNISPKSIILSKSKRQFILVGFSKAIKITQVEGLKTKLLSGNPEYIAPEQTKGKTVFASDIYSLGVSCLYLLTGIPPFDLFDDVNSCWRWRDYLLEGVSDRLSRILDKMVAPSINHRFQSIDEVQEAIQGHQAKFSNLVEVATTTIAARSLISLEASITSLAINHRTLAIGSDDGTISLLDLLAEKAIATLTGHSSTVKSLAFNSQGTLASGSDDQTIKLWTQTEQKEFSGHSNAVKSVAFNPTGSLLASGSWDKTIKLWDVQTGLERKTLIGHTLQVTSVAFSPCGNYIASGSCDRTIRIWDLAANSSYPLKGHAWSVFAVAFSPDGETLASGSDDNTIMVWNWRTKKVIYILDRHSWSVVTLAFSRDGQTLISGSWDKTVKLWQVNTGKEIMTLTGHLDSVTAVVMSDDGQIVSGSKDKTVKLWQV